MGRSLLSDRHGIFVQFSRRKITWLGVICITELDLVTQHYPCPPARPPPRQTLTHTRTHTLTAPPPCLPSLCKTTNYQINIPNSPRSLHSSGQKHSKTCQENKCKRENALWVLVAVCVRLWVHYTCVWSERPAIVSSVALKRIEKKSSQGASVCLGQRRIPVAFNLCCHKWRVKASHPVMPPMKTIVCVYFSRLVNLIRVAVCCIPLCTPC